MRIIGFCELRTWPAFVFVGLRHPSPPIPGPLNLQTPKPPNSQTPKPETTQGTTSSAPAVPDNQTLPALNLLCFRSCLVPQKSSVGRDGEREIEKRERDVQEGGRGSEREGREGRGGGGGREEEGLTD